MKKLNIFKILAAAAVMTFSPFLYAAPIHKETVHKTTVKNLSPNDLIIQVAVLAGKIIKKRCILIGKDTLPPIKVKSLGAYDFKLNYKRLIPLVYYKALNCGELFFVAPNKPSHFDKFTIILNKEGDPINTVPFKAEVSFH